MALPQIQMSARGLRDAILFTSGLFGLGFELFSSVAEKPTLIIAFGSMVGLPAIMRGDERKRAAPPSPTPVPQPTNPAPVPPGSPGPEAP